MATRETFFRRACAWLLLAPALLWAWTPAMAAAMSPAAEGSSMKFVATQMDVELEGAFKAFSADVDFDPAKLDRSKVEIVVDLASVDTGSADGDTLLKGKDFFDVAHYPQARFSAKQVKALAPGKYLANGEFTLKGHSATLAVPFSVRTDGEGTWVDGSVPVSRLAFGVGQGEWADTGTLSDEVRVNFRLRLPRRRP